MTEPRRARYSPVVDVGEVIAATGPVITLSHGPSGLSKATWTDADFSSMGWHDCRVHAVSIGEYADDTVPPARMLLDLDYIVRWVQPTTSENHFTFWVAPATLVFERAWNIEGTLGPLHQVMEIADIHRLPSPDNTPEPLWHIEGQNFDLRLRAAGYTQHIRLPPQHVPRQSLTSTERAGTSFAERSNPAGFNRHEDFEHPPVSRTI
jgi:hypothetical protein